MCNDVEMVMEAQVECLFFFFFVIKMSLGRQLRDSPSSSI